MSLRRIGGGIAPINAIGAVGSAVRNVAKQILVIETATVRSNFANRSNTTISLDSDINQTPITAFSLAGPLQRDTRVFCLRYPPHGLLILGVFSDSENYTQNFTSVGANDWTRPPGLRGAWVQVQGGGGAGGGANTTAAGQISAGSGGGGGACALAWVPALLLPASGTVTVGAGGTGVSAGTGNTGGQSDFLGLVTANGGTGGNAMTATAPPFVDVTPGDGSNTATFASGVTGFVMSGSDGFFPLGLGVGAGQVRAGQGGGSQMAGSQRPSNANSTNGIAGQNYGGGGSGSSNGQSQGSPRAGADGGQGIVGVNYVFN